MCPPDLTISGSIVHTHTHTHTHITVSRRDVTAALRQRNLFFQEPSSAPGSAVRERDREKERKRERGRPAERGGWEER